MLIAHVLDLAHIAQVVKQPPKAWAEVWSGSHQDHTLCRCNPERVPRSRREEYANPDAGNCKLRPPAFATWSACRAIEHSSFHIAKCPNSQGRNLCKHPCHTRSRRGRRAGDWEVSEVAFHLGRPTSFLVFCSFGRRMALRALLDSQRYQLALQAGPAQAGAAVRNCGLTLEPHVA